MPWKISADQNVAEAVIAVFSDSAEGAHAGLSMLKPRDWDRSYYWLIASGMALYLLDRVQALGIESALPAAILGRLRQNLLDHRKRTAFMMAEFVAINRAFLQAGMNYCNVKGFTLSPGYCPDPVLRSQIDFDFLVDGRHLDLCRAILEERGYIRTDASRNEWVFKADASEMVRTEDHYKLRPHRIAELHFSCTSDAPYGPSCDERLDRLSQRKWGSHSFPVLLPEDQFVEQALHLLSHLRSPSTRLAWLLEYKRFVSAHDDDHGLWSRVHDASLAHDNAPIAIGLATLLSRQFFGGRSPAQLDAWTLDRLPPSVRLWADCYGRKAVFACLPGTKLYLLLEGELAARDAAWATKRRRRLLPLRRIPQVLVARRDESFWKWVLRGMHQARFILFRVRFHVVEDLRYLVEMQRWHSLVASEQQDAPQPLDNLGTEQALTIDTVPNP